MSDLKITTSTGTNIWVATRVSTGDRIVVLENPYAPSDMRMTEAGRIIDGGFQPAPSAAWGLRPEVLRAIADVIEAEAEETDLADALAKRRKPLQLVHTGLNYGRED